MLRQVAVLLERENDKLHAKLHTLTAELARLRGDARPAAELELEFLKELLAQRERALFGASSEQRPWPATPPPSAPPVPRRGHGPTAQPTLPMVDVVHELAAADLTCPQCGGTLREMAEQTEDADEITVVERRFVLLKHRLRGRPVAPAGDGRSARGRRRWPRALLRRRAEERPLALGEELLEKFELELGGGPGVAAQTGELGGQGVELGVEFVVLALEEDRDLTEHLRIADRIEPEHTCTTSSCRRRSKMFLQRRDDHRRRREHHAPDERAAFEKQLQLAHGQAHDARLGVAPQAREAAALEPFGVDAEPGAVPQEHLGPLAGRVHEQVAVAGERILAEALHHERAQPVEALAQVRRRSVRPHRDLPRRADHASARSTAISPSRSNPSTRWPCGVRSTRPVGRGVLAGAGTTATGRSEAAAGLGGLRNHRPRLWVGRPRSRATRAIETPRSRRGRASASAAARNAAG